MTKEVKKRDISYEIIRVIAMIMVVVVHEMPTYTVKQSDGYPFLAFDALLCTCNALFFLLAGRFAFRMNLDDKNLYKKYYWKKALGLIIPMLVYMAIKNWHVMVYNQHLTVTPISYIKHFGIALVNGFSYMEYWFLYILIACFLATPFFARMVQNMKDQDKKAFFIVGLIMSTITTFVPVLGVSFAVKYYFVGHILLFFLGAMIEDIFKDKKAQLRLYAIGLLSLVINTILILVAHYTEGYKSTSPFYILFSVASFIFIKNVIKLPKKLDKVILFLGKHSLAVYMTHIIVLYAVNDLFVLPNGILSLVLASILITVGSVLVGFIIDNTIIKWLQKLTIKIFKLENMIK